ncbi:uncharacterized protein MELLADRAFT_113336 [Melampsora larici-populina 98AG31]|uniref:Methyltransferase small domain-containing protein n=1 Tax=Melampsora larici-populina (strain 98AG31 / pathotype 3-4-7) TaxID=747676 RepID=F4S9J2_MELLP|nr:uncharacterized protein MELLADRAFT_113336 [Melampsora larici-populina 98AG31]EGF98691.1 hypothetical protein MELLADRAFT_113336 [Melampsora larici-populina 98AG31]
MKLKSLETFLQSLEGFRTPKVELEQYVTSAHLASRMIFTAHNNFNQILNKSILDLGSGTGLLSIACSYLDLSNPNFLNQLKSSIPKSIKPTSLDPLLFDTVVMNPPFGTKRKGIDMVFLEIACQLAKSEIYSLHKSSTRDYIQRKSKQWGFNGQVIAEMRYDLPKTLKMHKVKSLDIQVDLWRFDRIKAL